MCMETVKEKINFIYTYCYQREEVSMSQKWVAVILLLLMHIVPIAMLPFLG